MKNPIGIKSHGWLKSYGNTKWWFANWWDFPSGAFNTGKVSYKQRFPIKFSCGYNCLYRSN